MRVKVIKTLFEKSFRENMKVPMGSAASEILARQKEIDKIIKKNAPAWPISQMAPIDLATLRFAIWELLSKKEPYKVIVDEAVEVAKEYGHESSASFVNGVLGTIIKSDPKLKGKKNA